MFTKEDFIKYFQQVLDIEKKMEETYRYLTDQITHPEYRKTFRHLADEEQVHQRKIEEIIQLFKR